MAAEGPRRRDALAAAPRTGSTARRTAAARPAAAAGWAAEADTSEAVCTVGAAAAEGASPPPFSCVNADLFERATCRVAHPAAARALVRARARAQALRQLQSKEKIR